MCNALASFFILFFIFFMAMTLHSKFVLSRSLLWLFWLSVSYVWQPVVFLHGGPGAGTSANNRRFFDPEFYRIILFDQVCFWISFFWFIKEKSFLKISLKHMHFFNFQRGAGKSTPHACLEENTTWDLVDDIEKLREHLGISEWQVVIPIPWCFVAIAKYDYVFKNYVGIRGFMGKHTGSCI